MSRREPGICLLPKGRSFEGLRGPRAPRRRPGAASEAPSREAVRGYQSLGAVFLGDPHLTTPPYYHTIFISNPFFSSGAVILNSPPPFPPFLLPISPSCASHLPVPQAGPAGPTRARHTRCDTQIFCTFFLQLEYHINIMLLFCFSGGGIRGRAYVCLTGSLACALAWARPCGQGKEGHDFPGT